MLEPRAELLTAPADAKPAAADVARASADVARAHGDETHATVGGTRTTADAAAWPFVSIVIPCFNEERFIGEVLARLAAQYEPARAEIIVVDGGSTDGTRAIVADAAARLDGVPVRLIENPARHIPVALNLGIAAARGEIIARMDAHAAPSADYLRRAVELLGADEQLVVGMPCQIRPAADTLAARAVAVVVAHPFGIGDAQYRIAHAGGPRAVDTVPFGVFRKSLWRRLGGFDESLLTNEDYDFNYRVRRAGGRVLLDTAAHTVYYARPTLAALAAQYWRYGSWKARMLRLHPASLRWRHAVAPVFVLTLAALAVAGLVRRPAWLLLLAALGAYALPAFTFAFKAARRAGDLKLAAPVAAAFFVVHCAWGGGFWRGLFTARARARAAARKHQRDDA
ncbi:MAG TPA: glycosyltransferase family 2 protein [Pyrinomonadaceae bacterium]|jgi:cellulose synthase/poly-beta-1,6-N-acetylglucosamine synthase-like glycosyltransferase